MMSLAVLVWLLVSPVVAAGVLIAHSVAYRLTSTPSDPFHAYLGHAPQVLLERGLRAGQFLKLRGSLRHAGLVGVAKRRHFHARDLAQSLM